MDSTQLFMKWLEKYDTGIVILDEQHRGMVSILNSLYFLMQKNQSAEVLHHLADLMLQYFKVHFSTEEYLMQASNFPDQTEHKKIHDELIKKLKVVTQKCLNNKDPSELLVMLKNDWLKHLFTDDIKFVSQVKKYISNA